MNFFEFVSVIKKSNLVLLPNFTSGFIFIALKFLILLLLKASKTILFVRCVLIPTFDPLASII